MVVSSLKTLDNLPLVESTLNNRRGSIAPNQLYDCKMPNILKLQHEKNMLDFLKGRDLSHIVSVESSPSLVDNINNIIFENSSLNRSRGSANMTKLELRKISVNNLLTNLKSGFAVTGKNLLVAALFEIPVTAIEAFFAIKSGNALQPILITASKKIGISAAMSIPSTIISITFASCGISLGPVGWVLTTGGIVFYLWNGSKRTIEAKKGFANYLSLQQRNKNITKSVLISALSIACITAVKEVRKRRQKLPETGVMDFKPINSNQGLINKTLTPVCKTIGYVDGTVRGYSELLKHKLKNRKGYTKVKSIINETFTHLQESPRVGGEVSLSVGL